MLQDMPNELVKCAIRCRRQEARVGPWGEAGSSSCVKGYPSQSEIQNNCLCRFNNLPTKGGERERGEGEKES